MRIVLLKSHIQKSGGLEKYTLRLASAFAEKRADVIVLTSGYDGSLSLPGVQFINVLDKRSSCSFLHLLHFDAACQLWLKKNRADSVFGLDRNSSQTYYRAGNGVHAAYLQRRRQFESWQKGLSFTLNPLHRTLLSLEKRAYENPSLQRLFTNSHLVKQEILEHYATPEEKIEVVHNGVEWHELQSAFDASKPHQGYHLLFAGHGYQRKGLGTLLAGLQQHKEVHLMVVGKESRQKEWENKVKAMGLSDQVTFFGPQPSLIPFYQRADAIAIPSLYDPFANVTVEALAMGLFVLSSTSNGGHEILTPETGITFSDQKEIAHALEITLSHPKTAASAQKIRNSVRCLDFSTQLHKIVDVIL